MPNDDEPNVENVEIPPIDNDEDVLNNNKEAQPNLNTAPKPKVLRAMKKLEVWYNNDAVDYIKKAAKVNTAALATEFAKFMMNTTDQEQDFAFNTVLDIMTNDEPRTFQEAWDHSDMIKREKWRAAIQKEFNDMNRHGVWNIVKRKDVPPNGDLDEEIFMDCPKGLEGTGLDDSIKFMRSIYGLVQVARQWFKKFVHILRSCGFTGGNVDPYLMS